MRHSCPLLLLIVALMIVLLVGCSPPSARPTGVPTAEPSHVPAATAAPAAGLAGTWRRYTTADGLCTDRPWLIGGWYIGTGTTTMCSPDSWPLDQARWFTSTVPIGTQVTAAAKFPPGGGLIVATDAGICTDMSWAQPQKLSGYVWECQTPANGFPYRDIRGMTNLSTEPVYLLPDAVAYSGQTYRIPQLAGAAAARPTWIAVTTPYRPPEEIWAGTNGYGLVVIQPQTGVIKLYTTADGLPSDTIRDVNTGGKQYGVWIATDRGVGHWDGQRWTIYTTADGLPSDDVRGVSSSWIGTVWAATAGGAAYFDGQSWQGFTRANGLPAGELSGVMAWQDEVWFSTRGEGLLVFFIAEAPKP